MDLHYSDPSLEIMAGDALIQYAIELNAIDVIDRRARAAESFRALSVDHPNLGTLKQIHDP